VGSGRRSVLGRFVIPTTVVGSAIVAVAVVGGPLRPAVPVAAATPGLVAAYGFDEGTGTSALDASGGGLTGAVSGPTWAPTGRHGGALQFDGVNDSVIVPDAAALDLTTGMTIEAWVNPTALSGWRTVVLKERTNGLAYALYSSDGSGRPNSYLNVGGTDREVLAPSTIATGAWTHLAATYDGTTSRLFVNGAQVATLPLTGAAAISTGALRIGGNSVWAEWFSGLIDEVRIYNRAITPTEIQSDMVTPIGAGTPPPPPPTTTAPPDASAIGRWTGPVELGMVAVNMVQLHTGKILMWRGETMGGTSATLYDPPTGSQRPIPAPYNIFCSGNTQLADGRVLIVGGHDSDAGILGSARAAIFDPVSETWTSVPSMSQRRWYPSAVTLPDGRVLVTSGAKTAFDEIADIPEIYDPATNTWTPLTSARLSFPYYPFSYVLPDGKVLIAGAGEHAMPTYALDVAQQQWTTVDPVVVDGGSSAMFAPGRIVKTGTAATTDVNNDPTSTSTYVLDMTAASPRWRQTAPMAHPRAYHTLTPLPDGSVIVTGGGVTTEGKDVTAAVYEAEIWSPTTETWSTMARMQVPRLYHGTAMLLPDARVIVAGSGDSYGGPNQTTAEFFEPPYLFKGPRPALSGTPTSVAHGSTFEATVSGTIGRVSLERLGAVTHQFDENARHIDLAFQQSGDHLTVTAPANANVAPPGYYLLFAVSDQGVPSVARFIRLPAAGADAVPPNAPGNVSATGALGRVDLSWDAATDNVGVAGYDVHRSTVSGFTPAVSNRIAQTTTATSYADVGLAAGAYYYRIVARDAAGNVSAPSAQASATALADTTSPTVVVTAPSADATVSGSVTITATATDDVGVASVQFRVDGLDVGLADTTAPYSASWNSASVTNGGHTITAVGRDAAGNQGTSAGVTVTVSNTSPPPPSGLVGAWSFDEGAGLAAGDSSTKANHAVVSGATWTSDAKFGSALSFDGTNDRVDIADSASLDLTTGMTLEAWVKPTSTSGWRTALLKERPGGLAYALYASDGTRPTGLVNVDGGDVGPSGTAGLGIGAWTHIATTFDGTTQRLFVNGVQVSTRATAGSMLTSANPLRIGGNAIWNEWFAGVIDEVRVYDRALTAAQIQADMTTSIGSTPPPTTTTSTTTTTTTTTTTPPSTTTTTTTTPAPTSTTSTTSSTTTTTTTPPPPRTGLVGAWSFDAAGSVAADASPSANNGTVSGATWTAAGRIGGALTFDGVNDRVDVPDSASLDLTGAMTVEAWVRPTATTGWRTVLMKERTNGLAYALYSNNDQGRPEVDVRIVADRVAAGPAALPANQWTHLAATYDGATLRIYVNGTSVGSRPQTGATTVSASPLRIGGNAVWSEWFAGSIDEVRVYNRALSATEIQGDMTAPIG
jgi:Concanavalin A-like lectin/glucanases superfamily/Galactose oxidase-like, Early set domain/Bacterial Ig domain/Glyoxal oxidase N-terminus/Galactose oxidase, central domain